MEMKRLKKAERESGCQGMLKSIQPVMGKCNFGHPYEKFFEDTKENLTMLNKDWQKPGPNHALEGVLEELGEHSLINIHRRDQVLEGWSGRFYPEERGLAKICHPMYNSYLTARPFRCNPIYRCCEPIKASYAGHVPGEQFTYGMRDPLTRNSLKYMTFRI